MTAHSAPARVAVREVVPVSKKVVPIDLFGALTRAIIDQDGCTWLYLADVCAVLRETAEIEMTPEFMQSDYFAATPDGAMLLSGTVPIAMYGDVIGVVRFSDEGLECSPGHL